MFKLVTIFLFIGAAFASDQDTYNQIVDLVLSNAAELMVDYKLDTLPIPPSTVAFSHQKIGTWSDVTGTLKFGVGTLVNATGIHRNGDASIKLVDEDKLQVVVGVYTDTLIATFSDFDVDFSSPFPFSNNGGMQIKLGKNEIIAQFTFMKAPQKCSLTVDSAQLTTLGSMDFLILPDTWWAEVKDKGLDVYMSSNRDNVKVAVNLYIKSILQGAISKVDPCKFFPF